MSSITEHDHHLIDEVIGSNQQQKRRPGDKDAFITLYQQSFNYND